MQADMRQHQRSWLKFLGMNRRRNSVSKPTAPTSGAAISGTATPGSAVRTAEQSWQQQTRTSQAAPVQRNRASLNRLLLSSRTRICCNSCAHDCAVEAAASCASCSCADAPKPTAEKKDERRWMVQWVRSEARNRQRRYVLSWRSKV